MLLELLRQFGFNITSISEENPGISNQEVLNFANKLVTVLIAEDKDIGELIFRLQQLHSGILLIRLNDLPRMERISH